MQYQRHLPVPVEIGFSLRRFCRLMLRRPFRCPIPAHLNIVNFHLFFRDFVPRTLRQSVFNPRRDGLDRKSTRLNSSHMSISYAVFCLKKKKYTYSRSITALLNTVSHPADMRFSNATNKLTITPISESQDLLPATFHTEQERCLTSPAP